MTSAFTCPYNCQGGEGESWGAFHFSELTGQTTIKEMVFQQKLFGKAYFIVKMTAPARVWPVSSDK